MCIFYAYSVSTSLHLHSLSGWKNLRISLEVGMCVTATITYTFKASIDMAVDLSETMLSKTQSIFLNVLNESFTSCSKTFLSLELIQCINRGFIHEHTKATQYLGVFNMTLCSLLRQDYKRDKFINIGIMLFVFTS